MLTPEELEIVRLSVKVALVSVAISVPFGVAVAYALARWQFPGKSLFDALVHLPLVLPPVVTGLGKGIELYSWFDLPDDPRLSGDLHRYFPQAVRRGFAEAIGRHRLRREIIATQIVNSLVNRVGPTFVQDLTERTGAKPAEVARAYAIAREVFDLRPWWQGIEALDGQVLAAVQLQMHQESGRLLDRTVAWFLTHLPHPLDEIGRASCRERV